jgi:hypothetical protein
MLFHSLFLIPLVLCLVNGEINSQYPSSAPSYTPQPPLAMKIFESGLFRVRENIPRRFSPCPRYLGCDHFRTVINSCIILLFWMSLSSRRRGFSNRWILATTSESDDSLGVCFPIWLQYDHGGSLGRSIYSRMLVGGHGYLSGVMYLLGWEVENHCSQFSDSSDCSADSWNNLHRRRWTVSLPCII